MLYLATTGGSIIALAVNLIGLGIEIFIFYMGIDLLCSVVSLALMVVSIILGLLVTWTARLMWCSISFLRLAVVSCTFEVLTLVSSNRV